MEINELQKMIFSIGQKKSKCRGNLRLKVLLKTTHDYVRESWIAGQLGNPQNLHTILRNSGTNCHSDKLLDEERQNHDAEQQETSLKIPTYADEAYICEDFLDKDDCYEDLQNRLTTKSLLETKAHVNVTLESKELETSNLTVQSSTIKNQDKVLLDQTNSCGYIKLDYDENGLKVQKLLNKVKETCDFMLEIEETQVNDLDRHSYYRKQRRIKKLFKQLKTLVKIDYENESFSRQKKNRKLLRLIRKFLKKYECFLKIIYVCEKRSVMHQKHLHRLKKLTKKLKKFVVHMKTDYEHTKPLEEKREIISYTEKEKILEMNDKTTISDRIHQKQQRNSLKRYMTNRADCDLDAYFQMNHSELYVSPKSFVESGHDYQHLDKEVKNCPRKRKIKISFEDQSPSRKRLKYPENLDDESSFYMETDECEHLLELDGFFTSLKAVQFSDNNRQ